MKIRNYYISTLNYLEKIYYRRGTDKKCYICKRKVKGFTKYRDPTINISNYHKIFNMIGCDTDFFGCPYCKGYDRERHLFMYFDKLNLWDNIKGYNILHFAPEKRLSKKIESIKPKKYIKADLSPQVKDHHKIDVTNIPYDNNSFHFIICNHILEHIPNYKKAIKEIFRVLRPNSYAVLQTPYSKNLLHNFESTSINTKELRSKYYGLYNHVRIFSENDLFNSFKKAGFILKIAKHNSLFSKNQATYYGVSNKEDLILVYKN